MKFHLFIHDNDRRPDFKSFGILISIILAGAIFNSTYAQRKAFALVGDCFHPVEIATQGLTRNLIDGGAEITIDFTSDVEQVTEENITQYDLIMFFRDGEATNCSRQGTWITQQMGEAIKNYVNNGGSAFFFHNSTNMGLLNPDVADVLKATYMGHPEVRPYKLEIIQSGHPVVDGASDFTVSDEQQYMAYTGEDSSVFLRAINENGYGFDCWGTCNEGPESNAGWAHEYGDGRVVYMSPGHTLESLVHEEYAKMQRNAVAWLLENTPATKVKFIRRHQATRIGPAASYNPAVIWTWQVSGFETWYNAKGQIGLFPWKLRRKSGI
jgi:type 1 glutamine amidotransferase